MRFHGMIVNPVHANVVSTARRRLGAARFATLVGGTMLVLAAHTAGGWVMALIMTVVAGAIAEALRAWLVARLTEDREVFLPAYALSGLYVPRDTDAIRLWKSATVMWSIRSQLGRLHELDDAEVLTAWRQAEYDALSHAVGEAYELAARIVDPARVDVP